jgi:glycosyltransferase involved in cell wall biosynthesis
MTNSLREIVVLIPAYNEATTIRDIVERAAKIVPNVVVVDDGSSDTTVARLHDLPVTLLRNARRLGKAASLWNGIEHALAHGAKSIVTLDGDGQHRPEDIERLLHTAQRYPDRIVIGARLHDKRNFPPLRYFANRVACFAISWAAGHSIVDTQSGFRVYPASVLRRLTRRDVSWNGFVFESEILIAAGRLGVQSVAVSIPGIYPKDARASYFRPVRDVARIVSMVTWRLLRGGFYPTGLLRSLQSPTRVEAESESLESSRKSPHTDSRK